MSFSCTCSWVVSRFIFLSSLFFRLNGFSYLSSSSLSFCIQQLFIFATDIGIELPGKRWIYSSQRASQHRQQADSSRPTRCALQLSLSALKSHGYSGDKQLHHTSRMINTQETLKGQQQVLCCTHLNAIYSTPNPFGRYFLAKTDTCYRSTLEK